MKGAKTRKTLELLSINPHLDFSSPSSGIHANQPANPGAIRTSFAPFAQDRAAT